MAAGTLADGASRAIDPDSKLVALDCFPAKLRLKKPVLGAAGKIEQVSVLYVRLKSANGTEGWGEAIADPSNTGETVAGMIAMIDVKLRAMALGRSAYERVAIMASMKAGVFGNGGAMTAIDVALIDLVGKLRGIPAVEVLGGPKRAGVPILAIVGSSGSAVDAFNEVKEGLDSGIRAFKLKVGCRSLQDDVKIIGEIRRVIGDGCFLAADANMAWDISTAVKFARAAVDEGLDYLEQPVAKDHHRMAMLAAQSPVPISGDESIQGLNELLALNDLKAIQGASLKSIKLGGVTQAVRMAVIGDGLGLSIGVAMMMESGLATSGMIHAACAVPQIDWFLNLGVDFLAEDPINVGIIRNSGFALCTGEPGLGVEVRVEQFRC
ncbi:mandelate racemase/muconate lactonizing enzyme family protein [Leptospira interrogans]